jgi:L-2-hydroxyglutarate oxidase LhgO
VETDAVVIGAGVIGLAIARALARRGQAVVVIEAERAIAQHSSSRNSEVLHAGIYYAPGSAKARMCVAGRTRLLAYCEARGIAHRVLGKLVVATAEHQHDALAELRARALANGVELHWRSAAEVQQLEPALRCTAALWSAGTAIVDSHGLLVALQRDAIDGGTAFVLGTRFERASPIPGGLRVYAGGEHIDTRALYLAAGAWAPQLAATIEGFDPAAIPAAHFAKGNYFALRDNPGLSHLIYPLPSAAGLGIHATLDLVGNVRLGPDVQWVDGIEYDVDPTREEAFFTAVREWLPALSRDALRPALAGIRAKIVGPGEPAADFVVRGAGEHGCAGVVALFGIESPGLTACLELADAAIAATD